MALTQIPRIERLDLARVELPADHPAADLGQSVAVHARSRGFLFELPGRRRLPEPPARDGRPALGLGPGRVLGG